MPMGMNRMVGLKEMVSVSFPTFVGMNRSMRRPVRILITFPTSVGMNQVERCGFLGRSVVKPLFMMDF